MQKILSYRNIASLLFITAFVVFVLAQRYTIENGPKNAGIATEAIIFSQSVKSSIIAAEKKVLKEDIAVPQ